MARESRAPRLVALILVLIALWFAAEQVAAELKKLDAIVTEDFGH